MKKLCFTSLILLISLLVVGQNATIPAKQVKSITEKNLISTMRVLTSDSLAGRATGKPGAAKAADYIENYYKKVGLVPFSENSYKQPFQLWGLVWGDAEMVVNGVSIVGNNCLLNTGTIPQAEAIEKEVVFVGNGNDSILGKLNLRDKIVVVSIDNLRRPLDIRRKLSKSGAWAVIGVNLADSTQFQNAANGVLQMRSYAGVSARAINLSTSGERFLLLSNQSIPKLFGKTAPELFELTKSDDFQGLFTSASIKFDVRVEPVEAWNVIGVLKGTNPSLKPIAVTAHYDHVGMQPDGDVCLGADDNASGVSTLMEMARAMASKKHKPLRDIMFIACGAEELGLLGSAYFMEVKTKDDFFANINIDMIGRRDTLTKDNYVYILGTDKNPWAHNLHQEANKQTVNLTLDYHYNRSTGAGSYMNRSDHYHFYRKGIPVISFFSGLHDDYHTPRDTMDKIDFKLMTKRVKLAYGTLYLLANQVEMKN